MRESKVRSIRALFQFTGAVAFPGNVFSQFHGWTWKGLGTGIMIEFMVDGLIHALITAGTSVWLWPAAA